MDYTVYNLSTGEIAKSGQCTESSLGLKAKEGQGLLVGEAVNDSQYYIDLATLQPIEKPSLECEPQYHIPADGVTEVTFYLPPNTIVFHSGDKHDVVSGENFEFVTDIPGTYHFHILAGFPYKECEVTINAV